MNPQNSRPSRRALIFIGTNTFCAHMTRSTVRRKLLYGRFHTYNGHSKGSLRIMPKLGTHMPLLHCLASSPSHCPASPPHFCFFSISISLESHLQTNPCLRVCFKGTPPEMSSHRLLSYIWSSMDDCKLGTERYLQTLLQEKGLRGISHIPICTKEYGTYSLYINVYWENIAHKNSYFIDSIA